MIRTPEGQKNPGVTVDRGVIASFRRDPFSTGETFYAGGGCKIKRFWPGGPWKEIECDRGDDGQW